MVWAGFEYKVGGAAVKAALYSVSSAASLPATEIRPRLIRTLWSKKASKVATRLGHKCASAHTAQEEVCLKLWTEIN